MTAKVAEKYNHQKIEKKWQKKWEKTGLYTPDIPSAKRPFYNLWMFPYPSAEGLHAGHVFASTGSDVYGRFMRMRGKDVFQPIGYDSFGIHSENFALKIGEHPQKMLSRTIKNYERQLMSLGHGYDWNRTLMTSDIDYYRWTQWLFIQMFKAGLAYRAKARVNWCPSCKTVLADEQVISGRCERCSAEVEHKELEQWFFKITSYADRLLANLEKIDWPEKIKTIQKNWIGRSKGMIIKFKNQNSKISRRAGSRLAGKISVFTTRPDTLFGTTFLVLSPEKAKKFLSLVPLSKKATISKYIERTLRRTKQERKLEEKERIGLDMGFKAINPANQERVPVFVADYVLMEHGTGAVMGVPGHDHRDWDFAKKYNLPIIEVVGGGQMQKAAYTGPGKLINSDEWNGWQMPQQLDKVLDYLEKKKWAKKTTTYHLRDWLISRQRYWGPPIPMIYCPKCAKKGKASSMSGWYPVEESELPVELPYYRDYQPKGGGRGPLADHPEFYQTKCPVCGAEAQRETDVSDTFLDSSWYFLRYPSTRSARSGQVPFDPKITKKWLPVNLYFGGAEHAVLHLLYARFISLALDDMGYLKFSSRVRGEPFPWFYSHGLMIKDGAKMSKSRGNVVNPDEYIEKFGADTLRLYLIFMGPMDGTPDFRDTGIEGMHRFLMRVWGLFQSQGAEQLEKELLVKMHQTIKKVTEDIEKFHYNTAISSIMEYVNVLRTQTQNSNLKTQNNREWSECLRVLVLLLAPFAPHLAEEIWQNLSRGAGSLPGQTGQKSFKSIHLEAWPKYNSKLIKETLVRIVVQVNDRVRSQIDVDSLRLKDETYVEEMAKKDEKARNWLKSRKIRRVVYVPGRLINFLVTPGHGKN